MLLYVIFGVIIATALACIQVRPQAIELYANSQRAVALGDQYLVEMAALRQEFARCGREGLDDATGRAGIVAAARSLMALGATIRDNNATAASRLLLTPPAPMIVPGRDVMPNCAGLSAAPDPRTQTSDRWAIGDEWLPHMRVVSRNCRFVMQAVSNCSLAIFDRQGDESKIIRTTRERYPAIGCAISSSVKTETNSQRTLVALRVCRPSGCVIVATAPSGHGAPSVRLRDSDGRPFVADATGRPSFADDQARRDEAFVIGHFVEW